MKVKGIMFSGFAAAILMGSAGAYAAGTFNIASQAYVDQEVGKLSGENGAITALAEKIGGNYTSESTVADAIATKANASDLTLHINDAVKHITAEERTAWNAKQAALDADQLAAVNSGITADKVAAYDTLAGDSANSVEGKIESAISSTLGEGWTEGQTVKQALTANSTADQAYADTKAGAAETAAKAYADGLASNYATAAQGGKADTAVQPAAIANMQVTTNIATDLSETFADDTQYPSAKAVKTAIDGVSSGSSEAVTALENKIGSGFTSENTVADAIAAINNPTTGIAAVASTDATTKANAAEQNAKDYSDTKFGGGTNVTGLPAYSTCPGTSGKCVLAVSKTTGALEWVEITAPLTSNN